MQLPDSSRIAFRLGRPDAEHSSRVETVVRTTNRAERRCVASTATSLFLDDGMGWGKSIIEAWMAPDGWKKRSRSLLTGMAIKHWD